jgi:hypothetical protein
MCAPSWLDLCISAGAASVGTLTGSEVGGHRGRQVRRVRHTTNLALKLRALVLLSCTCPALLRHQMFLRPRLHPAFVFLRRYTHFTTRS